jgi:gamma-glutamyl phosphate reductase
MKCRGHTQFADSVVLGYEEEMAISVMEYHARRRVLMTSVCAERVGRRTTHQVRM